ncbi:Ig-like domain-containing protein [Shewanella sp. 10N.286.52.B9]|uniref:Ig-like domain-containing protein n=1 Tax=Shewanella sp. 10N.286.52.B9 TaxID=1880837 RepID=UPI0010550E27|nr:Ig-like domain-containing protein [Shewanella sp. 10N.286.52.B9]
MARLLIATITLLASLTSVSAWALGAWDIQRVKFGHVLARGLVLDDAGYPTYVEYTADGTKVGGWSQSLASAKGAYVLPAEQVKSTQALLSDLKTENNKVIVLTREQYDSQDFTSKFDKPLTKLELSPIYKSVVVKAKESILHESDTHVLLLSRFDLSNIANIDNNAQSVLFDKSGQVLHSSANNIAFDSGFYEGDGGSDAVPPLSERISSKTYAPFQGAQIEAWINGFDVTDTEGKFTAQYNLVPCPCFSFSYDNVPLIMKHYYAGFTSRGVKPLIDAQIRPGYDFCSGYDACPLAIGGTLSGAMAQVAIIGIYASSASPALQPSNFYVDTGFITGKARLAPIGAETQYVYKEPNLDPISQQHYDFDGDSKFDDVKMGNIVDGLFVCSADTTQAEYQGVYISSVHEGQTVYANCADDEPEITQPDILRLADHQLDTNAQGLVGQISQEDLQDTDILVFRESNGLLITHRKGINENELSKNRSYYGVEGDEFIFQMMIRGPANVFAMFEEMGPAGYSKFQSDANMDPSLHQRESDHLKPGEAIRIVLVNRKTGYIGSLRTSYTHGYQGGNIAFNMNDVQMNPPNLKISAERRFTIKEGMSASNEQHKKLITYEGSAMSDDEMVTITTEWYDVDGTPLPDGMNDFGYTGRLAKVAGPGMLVSSGGSIDNFAIRPGKHIEHIRLADMGNPADHFYIQVNGQSKHENPSFADGGAAPSGPLAQRPKHYVPFLVPVLDEAVTLEQEYLYKKLVADGLDDGIEKPEPLYRWVYRPELQFSTYDLKVDDIIRQRNDDLTSSIYQDDIPMIASSDNAVSFLYNLIESNEEALAFLGAGQELVFALGATEIKAKLGEGNQIIFTNLEHIAALDVEDFVTLSLYSNNDPTNVLWEYAFESVAIDTRWAGHDNIGEDGTIYVSADDPVVPAQAFILGYANRENKKPLSLKWVVKGQGTAENKSLEYKDQGVFPADIKMSTVAGSRATAEVYIDNPNNVTKLDAIEVVAGKPAVINVEMTGEAFIEGHKGIQVSVQAWDAHGNKVADGTSINFSLDGVAILADADDGIDNGAASAFIIGGVQPDDEAKLIVSVGDVTQTLDFEVQPLKVVISDYTANMEPSETYPVTVTVTEPNGTPAIGVPVKFDTTAGRFKKSYIETGSNGQAIAQLHSGFYRVDDYQVSARVGLTPAVSEQGKITPKGDTYSDTRQTLIVGDETTNGYAEYERYDGANIGLNYETSADVFVYGKPNETLNLTLGTLSEPNIQPIAGYVMSDLVVDYVPEVNGLHNGTATRVTIAEDNPLGVGQSYAFDKNAYLNSLDIWESSKIEVALDPKLKPQDSVGFRVDVKATTAGGNIFTLEGGVQKLALLDDGRFEYKIYTEDGAFSVYSAAVSNSKWLAVAGRYNDGYLELEIDGVLSRVAATGKLSYTVSQRGLTLGENFTGKLSSFKLYDWNSQPLMTFEDGTTTKQVMLAVNQEHEVVKVISTGNFNQLGESANMLRIGLQTNDTQTYVGVIAKTFYGQLASMYTDGLKPEGYPPLASNTQQYRRYTPVPFIGVANAGFLDWINENAFDAMKAAVGFLIPYEEGIGLVKQIYYLVTDDDDFDVMELTLNAIAVISVFPPAKALLPLSKGLRFFLKPLKGSIGKFVKATGGVMYKIINEATDKRYDTLMNLLPFLIIAGEMVADSEAREGLFLMIKSVASTDDLLSWMDYLSLPADGWEGDEIPPVIGENGDTETAMLNSGEAYPWAGMPFVGAAYAAKKRFKVDGAKLGKVFKELAEEANGNLDLKSMIIFIKNVRKGLKKTSAEDLRKLIFDKRLIAAGSTLAARSGQNLLNFLKGNTSSRISPSIMVAVVWYLEKSMADGTLENVDEVLHSRIRGRYGNAFTSIFTKGNGVKPTRLTNQAHGGMHQLATIAKLHLAQQQGLTDQKLKAVEGERKVTFYEEDGLGGIEVRGIQTRNVDIIVETDALKEKWIELKSYTHKRAFQVWKYGASGGGGSVGKEIIVDRVAKTRASDKGVQDQNGQNIEKVELSWLFQKFNVKKAGLPEQRSYNKNEFGKGSNSKTVLGKLARLEPDTGGVILTSLNYDNKSDNKHFESEINGIAKLDTISAWLIEYGKEFLFKDFPIENIK